MALIEIDGLPNGWLFLKMGGSFHGELLVITGWCSSTVCSCFFHVHCWAPVASYEQTQVLQCLNSQSPGALAGAWLQLRASWRRLIIKVPGQQPDPGPNDKVQQRWTHRQEYDNIWIWNYMNIYDPINKVLLTAYGSMKPGDINQEKRKKTVMKQNPEMNVSGWLVVVRCTPLSCGCMY